jgi:DNA-binding IclR family transcriptional regulator
VRDEAATGGLQSVKRALTALELVADAGELGVSELGRQLGVHKATASRLAATLAERGLLERDPVTERYRIGFGLVRLAGAAMSGLDLVRTSRPILEELAERTRESANLGVLSGDGVVYVDQVAGSQAIVTVNWVGRRRPARHVERQGPAGVHGRCGTGPVPRRAARHAHGPDRRRLEVLRGQLAEVRRRYAQTLEELEEESQRGRRPGAAGGRSRDRRARRVGAGVPDAGRRPAAIGCGPRRRSAAVSRQLGYLDRRRTAG